MADVAKINSSNDYNIINRATVKNQEKDISIAVADKTLNTVITPRVNEDA